MVASMINHRHPIETIAAWGSAAILSFAAGFFVRVAVGGADEMLALAGSLGAALAAGAGALAVQRRVGQPRWPHAAFDLSPIEHLVVQPAELAEASDVLLLTDSLDELPEDSRVVRLFEPETLHVPGELAGRIDEWLDGARTRLGERRERVSSGHGPDASPASAALHTALADIRRSLG